MKKYIPLILVVIFFCASFSVKIGLWDIKHPMFYEDTHCLQLLLLSPITILGGLCLCFFPRMTFGWLRTVLPHRKLEFWQPCYSSQKEPKS